MGNCLGKKAPEVAYRPEDQSSANARAEVDAPVLLERQAYAKHPYTASNDDELSFSPGQEFKLLEDADPEKPWLHAEKIPSGEQGMIPLTFVQCRADSPKFHPAWQDIIRNVAVRRLMVPGLPEGTYVIRPCSKNTDWFSLSLRAIQTDGDAFVKHHLIKKQAGMYYIVQSAQFPSVKELLDYHTGKTNRTAVKITEALKQNFRPPVRFESLDVNRDRIVRERQLGAGAFGEVFLARWNRQMTVAVKSLKVKDNVTEKDRQEFLDEARLMHKLSHPRIVQILAVCTQPLDQPMLLLTEYMSNGSLKDCLTQDLGANIMLNDLVIMMQNICDGMDYLTKQQPPIVHRDLRAANILVDEDYTAKVADFGLSRDDEYSFNAKSKYPVKWTAPEAMLQNLFTAKSDVWSFGVVMYEMITYGYSPYPGMSRVELQSELNRGYRMQNPHGMARTQTFTIVCPEEIYNTMTDCWKENPDTRPTFEYMKSFFDGIEFHTEEQYLG